MRKMDQQGEERAGTFICVVRGQYATCGTKGQILAAPLVPRALAHNLRPATSRFMRNCAPMTDIITKPNIKDEIKVERPRLHKVILVNDDFTPREFVVIVLKAEFRMSEDQALRVMMTAPDAVRVLLPSTHRMLRKPRQRTRRMRANATAIRCCSRPSLRNDPTGPLQSATEPRGFSG
jgi:hypothetical protein